MIRKPASCSEKLPTCRGRSYGLDLRELYNRTWTRRTSCSSSKTLRRLSSQPPTVHGKKIGKFCTHNHAAQLKRRRRQWFRRRGYEQPGMDWPPPIYYSYLLHFFNIIHFNTLFNTKNASKETNNKNLFKGDSLGSSLPRLCVSSHIILFLSLLQRFNSSLFTFSLCIAPSPPRLE